MTSVRDLFITHPSALKATSEDIERTPIRPPMVAATPAVSPIAVGSVNEDAIKVVESEGTGSHRATPLTPRGPGFYHLKQRSLSAAASSSTKKSQSRQQAARPRLRGAEDITQEDQVTEEAFSFTIPRIEAIRGQTKVQLAASVSRFDGSEEDGEGETFLPAEALRYQRVSDSSAAMHLTICAGLCPSSGAKGPSQVSCKGLYARDDVESGLVVDMDTLLPAACRSASGDSQPSLSHAPRYSDFSQVQSGIWMPGGPSPQANRRPLLFPADDIWVGASLGGADSFATASDSIASKMLQSTLKDKRQATLASIGLAPHISASHLLHPTEGILAAYLKGLISALEANNATQLYNVTVTAVGMGDDGAVTNLIGRKASRRSRVSAEQRLDTSFGRGHHRGDVTPTGRRLSHSVNHSQSSFQLVKPQGGTPKRSFSFASSQEALLPDSSPGPQSVSIASRRQADKLLLHLHNKVLQSFLLAEGKQPPASKAGPPLHPFTFPSAAPPPAPPISTQNADILNLLVPKTTARRLRSAMGFETEENTLTVAAAESRLGLAEDAIGARGPATSPHSVARRATKAYIDERDAKQSANSSQYYSSDEEAISGGEDSGRERNPSVSLTSVTPRRATNRSAGATSVKKPVSSFPPRQYHTIVSVHVTAPSEAALSLLPSIPSAVFVDVRGMGPEDGMGEGARGFRQGASALLQAIAAVASTGSVGPTCRGSPLTMHLAPQLDASKLFLVSSIGGHKEEPSAGSLKGGSPALLAAIKAVELLRHSVLARYGPQGPSKRLVACIPKSAERGGAALSATKAHTKLLKVATYYRTVAYEQSARFTLASAAQSPMIASLRRQVQELETDRDVLRSGLVTSRGEVESLREELTALRLQQAHSGINATSSTAAGRATLNHVLNISSPSTGNSDRLDLLGPFGSTELTTTREALALAQARCAELTDQLAVTTFDTTHAIESLHASYEALLDEMNGRIHILQMELAADESRRRQDQDPSGAINVSISQGTATEDLYGKLIRQSCADALDRVIASLASEGLIEPSAVSAILRSTGYSQGEVAASMLAPLGATLQLVHQLCERDKALEGALRQLEKANKQLADDALGYFKDADRGEGIGSTSTLARRSSTNRKVRQDRVDAWRWSERALRDAPVLGPVRWRALLRSLASDCQRVLGVGAILTSDSSRKLAGGYSLGAIEGAEQRLTSMAPPPWLCALGAASFPASRALYTPTNMFEMASRGTPKAFAKFWGDTVGSIAARPQDLGTISRVEASTNNETNMVMPASIEGLLASSVRRRSEPQADSSLPTETRPTIIVTSPSLPFSSPHSKTSEDTLANDSFQTRPRQNTIAAPSQAFNLQDLERVRVDGISREATDAQTTRHPRSPSVSILGGMVPSPLFMPNTAEPISGPPLHLAPTALRSASPLHVPFLPLSPPRERDRSSSPKASSTISGLDSKHLTPSHSTVLTHESAPMFAEGDSHSAAAEEKKSKKDKSEKKQKGEKKEKKDKSDKKEKRDKKKKSDKKDKSDKKKDTKAKQSDYESNNGN